MNIKKKVTGHSVENKADGSFESRILNCIAIPAFAINTNHEITHWNQAICKASGYSADEMIGTKNQWKPFHPSKRPTMADLIIQEARNQSLEKFYADKYAESTVLENAFEAEDYFPSMGEGERLSFTAAPINDIDGKLLGAVETLVVISDRKKAEQELIDSQLKYRELSTIDDLTQLYNSRYFYEQVTDEVDRCNRYDKKLSIALLDLDHFKALNYKHGHLFGNRVL